MTKKSLIQRLKFLIEEEERLIDLHMTPDSVQMHMQADDLLLDYIGDSEIREVYDEITKVYGCDCSR